VLPYPPRCCDTPSTISDQIGYPTQWRRGICTSLSRSVLSQSSIFRTSPGLDRRLSFCSVFLMATQNDALPSPRPTSKPDSQPDFPPPPRLRMGWENADHSTCSTCSKELAGVDTLEVAYHRDHSCHVQCCDWSAEPWPLPYLLPTMRSLCRSLPRFVREMVSAGHYIAGLEKQWPGKNAAQLLIGARRRRQALREFLSKAQIERRIRAIVD
jgi:hypothetical protein